MGPAFPGGEPNETEPRLPVPTVLTSELLVLHLLNGDPDGGCASAGPSGIGQAPPGPYVEDRL